MRRPFLFVLIFIVTLGLSIPAARAQTAFPSTVNLQALLRDPSGSLIQDPFVNLGLRLTNAQGAVIYDELQPQVPVVQGAVNVNLGEGVLPNSQPSRPTGGIPLDLFDPSQGPVFLEVQVGNNTPSDPIELTVVPYAAYAHEALHIAKESVGSEEIKNGSVKLEDLDNTLSFENLQGQVADGQIPATLVRTTDLQAHLNATSAHAASAITVEGPFSFSPGTSLQALLKDLDAALLGEVANRAGNRDTLTGKLVQEVSDRTSADTALQTNLDTHAALKTGVHGLTSQDPNNAIVGTTEAQTLENKTLTAPTVNGGTIDSATITNSSFSGNGSNITNLNGSNIASGTIDDARLSDNVTKLGPTIEGGEIASETITVANMSSDKVSQWNNDAGYITDGNTNWDNTYGFITDGNTGWDNSYGFITDGNQGWNNSYGFVTAGDFNFNGWDSKEDNDLLQDGSRAMTGDLDMGGKNIANVGAVDGVNVGELAGRVTTLEDEPSPGISDTPDNSILLSKLKSTIVEGHYDCINSLATHRILLESRCEDPEKIPYSLISMPTPGVYLPIVWINMTGDNGKLSLRGNLGNQFGEPLGSTVTFGPLKYGIEMIQTRRDYDGGPDEICFKYVLAIENNPTCTSVGTQVYYKVYKLTN